MCKKAKAVFGIPMAAILGLSVGPLASADIPPPPPNTSKVKKSGKQFATVPVQEKLLKVFAENATVSIVRDNKASEITVASNSPGNWNVQDGMIRQAVISGRKGVGMTSDALGARAIMNGLVYTMPDGPVRGLQMKQDGVFVNGEKLLPLKGNGEPKLDGEADSLQVIVPDSYAGGLSIGCAGKSEVKLSGWKGSDIQLTLVGDSTISTGQLSAINKAVVDNRSTGRADIGGLNAKVFVANLQGKGTVNVNDGTAEMSNATVSGVGTMTLKGNFKNLKQAVEGNGKIEVIK